jgi:hypothetical protein
MRGGGASGQKRNKGSTYKEKLMSNARKRYLRLPLITAWSRLISRPKPISTWQYAMSSSATLTSSEFAPPASIASWMTRRWNSAARSHRPWLSCTRAMLLRYIVITWCPDPTCDRIRGSGNNKSQTSPWQTWPCTTAKQLRAACLLQVNLHSARETRQSTRKIVRLVTLDTHPAVKRKALK